MLEPYAPSGRTFWAENSSGAARRVWRAMNRGHRLQGTISFEAMISKSRCILAEKGCVATIGGCLCGTVYFTSANRPFRDFAIVGDALEIP
jgi:hypothetical protein